MKSFGEFQVLNELGAGTVKAYKWRRRIGWPDYLYTLDALDGEQYQISVNLGAGGSSVGFSKGGAGMGKQNVATNVGITHAIKMMHTVVEVTKDALLDAYKERNATRSRVRFTVAGYDENKAKKLKLYTAFAKKAFKGATVKKTIVGFYVDIPESFYK
jgi:hypothetical protein